MSKNYSVKEQIKLLRSKFSFSENFNDLTNDNIIISDKNLLYKLAAFLMKENIEFIVLNAIFLKEEVINLSDCAKLNNNKITQLTKESFIDIDNYFILGEYINTEILIDFSKFKNYYLNSKTINHFSYLVVTKKQTFYILNRKNYSLIIKI